MSGVWSGLSGVTINASVDSVEAFAEQIGGVDAGPVTVEGGRTQWLLGGAVEPTARVVRAPRGIVVHEPADLTVRVRAGTTVQALDSALAEAGQCVAVPDWPGATVGGVLAVGQSGVRRLGWGPVRDTVLEARFVSAEGKVVKAGGPTVKNVSGFDLCRLLVGSMGTLGFLGELVLRTRPRPAAERWLSGEADPFELFRDLYRPAAMLWDGRTTWVLLDGHPADVEAQTSVAVSRGLAPTPDGSGREGAMPRPDQFSQRWSVRPRDLRAIADLLGPGTFLAEVGVGVVYTNAPGETASMPPAIAALYRRLRANFDPTGRLNPGRHPEGIVSASVASEGSTRDA